MTPDLPNINELDSEQLLALRDRVHEELKARYARAAEQAQRLEEAVNGRVKKPRGRKPKHLDNSTEVERTSS